MEWKNINEELPPIGEIVLLNGKDRKLFLGFIKLIEDRGGMKQKVWGIAYYKNCYKDFKCVSHWANIDAV